MMTTRQNKDFCPLSTGPAIKELLSRQNIGRKYRNWYIWIHFIVGIWYYEWAETLHNSMVESLKMLIFNVNTVRTFTLQLLHTVNWKSLPGHLVRGSSVFEAKDLFFFQRLAAKFCSKKDFSKIGPFSTSTRSKQIMELFRWNLFYRCNACRVTDLGIWR